MSFKITFSTIFLVILVVLLIPRSASALSIGVSPASADLGSININNIVPQSITLMLENTDRREVKGLTISVVGSGKDAVEIKEKDIFFDLNEEQKIINYSINPKLLSPGKYTANILISPNIDTLLSDGSNLKITVKQELSFEVTEKVFHALDLYNSIPTISGKPGSISEHRLAILNSGNVSESIDKVVLVVDSVDKYIEIPYFPKENSTIPSKNRLLLPVSFKLPTELVSGEYSGKIILYNKDTVLKEFSNIQIVIEQNKKIKKPNFIYYGGIAGLVVIVLVYKLIKR